MDKRQVSIRRGRPGTLDTLRLIYEMAREGSSNPYTTRFALTTPLNQWSSILRVHWMYEPEDEETLRSISVQARNLMTYQKMIGDCDDAAVVAAALCIGAKLRCSIVAVRPPESHEWTHVFVETTKPGGQTLRLDPTAPETADYQFWERLVYP